MLYYLQFRLSFKRAHASFSNTFVMEKKDMVPGDLFDIFDSSLQFEETCFEEGFNEGYKDGLAFGVEEGHQVGLKHGFITGEELGFYSGCVDVWESAVLMDPEAFPERVKKGILQMRESIKNYPVMEPEEETLQDLMGTMRSKFRVITAGIGIKISYDGHLRSKEGIGF